MSEKKEEKQSIYKQLESYRKSMDRMYWIFLQIILLYELLGSTPLLGYLAEAMARAMSGMAPELAALIYQSIMNLRFLIILPAVYNIIMEARDNRIRIILGGMLMLGWLYAFLMREQNDTYMFKVTLMMVASYGKDHKRILKYSMWLALSVMVLVILLNLLRIIPEYTLERDGRVRHSFGTLGPTNLAGHFCFIIMTYIFLADGSLAWWGYAIIVLLSVLNLWLVDGRTAFLSIFLATVGCLIYELIRKKQIHIPDKLRWIWERVLLVAYPLVSGVYLVMMFTYNEDPGIFYNKYGVLASFRGRLRNAQRVMGVTGNSLFGNYYQNYWVEGNVFKNTGNYEFLDSSYARLLLMYGIVAFALIISVFTVIQWRLMKKRQIFRMYLLAVLALHFVMEHHILEPAYNIFLLLCFAKLPDIQGNTDKPRR